MSQGGETFALGHAGIGRAGGARTLVQRLVRFSPQAARAVDPSALGRFKAPMVGELDLAVLLPQPPQEGEGMPATTLTHRAAIGAEEPVPHAAPPVPVQVEARAWPGASSDMPIAPHVAPSHADPTSTVLQAQGRVAASIEVFALDAAAGAVTPQAAATSKTPPMTPAAPLESAHQVAAPASTLPDRAPPSQAAGEAAPASAATPRSIPAPLAPRTATAAQAWRAAALADVAALSDAIAHSATSAQPGALGALAPVAATKEPELVQQLQAAPAKRAVTATSPMGQPSAPADARRPVDSVPPVGIVERLVEATRPRADEAVVRIGSVSVVMRPAAPPPPALAPATAPRVAPSSATAPGFHRNPWLSRGRGGD